MKNIIFIFLITPFFALAQLDTSYIIKQGGIFYNVRKIVNADGVTGSTVTTLLGDTTAMLARYQAAIVNRADQMATDVAVVSKNPEIIKQLLNDDNEATLLTGQSPQRAVQETYQSEFVSKDWTIDDGTTKLPIVFTNNAQGALRYSVNGGTTKQAVLLGAVIRLRSYPASPKDTDLYEISPGLFVSSDKTIKMRKAGQGAKRSTIKPTLKKQ